MLFFFLRPSFASGDFFIWAFLKGLLFFSNSRVLFGKSKLGERQDLPVASNVFGKPTSADQVDPVSATQCTGPGDSSSKNLECSTVRW